MSSTWSRAPRILTFFVARVISIERICRRWPRKWEWNRRSFFTTGLSVRKKWSSLLALQTFTLLPTGMRRRWFPERLLLPWERARPSFRLHIGTRSNCWTTVGARWFHFKIPMLLHKKRSNSGHARDTPRHAEASLFVFAGDDLEKSSARIHGKLLSRPQRPYGESTSSVLLSRDSEIAGSVACLEP